jgi:hypothetical protein
MPSWTCEKCNESFRSRRPDSRICSNCTKAKKEEEKKKHFEALDSLTIEERIRKLEEFAYEHSKAYHMPRMHRYK